MPHWDWNTAAGSPGSRVSALEHTAPEIPDVPARMPGPGEDVSFETHVKGLFRESDRRSMSFAFDLGAYDDVRQHASAILARVSNGSMPCDAPWGADKVGVFQRWVDGGMPA